MWKWCCGGDAVLVVVCCGVRGAFCDPLVFFAPLLLAVLHTPPFLAGAFLSSILLQKQTHLFSALPAQILKSLQNIPLRKILETFAFFFCRADESRLR